MSLCACVCLFFAHTGTVAPCFFPRDDLNLWYRHASLRPEAVSTRKRTVRSPQGSHDELCVHCPRLKASAESPAETLAASPTLASARGAAVLNKSSKVKSSKVKPDTPPPRRQVAVRRARRGDESPLSATNTHPAHRGPRSASIQRLPCEPSVPSDEPVAGTAGEPAISRRHEAEGARAPDGETRRNDVPDGGAPGGAPRERWGDDDQEDDQDGEGRE